jgi:hypothetical protein
MLGQQPLLSLFHLVGEVIWYEWGGWYMSVAEVGGPFHR